MTHCLPLPVVAELNRGIEGGSSLPRGCDAGEGRCPAEPRLFYLLFFQEHIAIGLTILQSFINISMAVSAAAAFP